MAFGLLNTAGGLCGWRRSTSGSGQAGGSVARQRSCFLVSASVREGVGVAEQSNPAVSVEMRNCLRAACRCALKQRRTLVGTEHIMFGLQTRMYGVGPSYFSKRYLRGCMRRLDAPDDRCWQKADFDKHELRALTDNGGPLPGDPWLWLDPDAGDVSPRIEHEVQATLSEVAWWACTVAGRRRPQWSDVRWTAGAQAALRRTLLLASAKGVGYATVRHLLAGVLAGSGNGATDLMRLRGRRRGTELRSLLLDAAMEHNGHRIMPLSGHLEFSGLLTQPPSRLHSWIISRFLPGRVPEGELMWHLETDARQQAIRLRHRRVGAVHLLLTLATLHEQLAGGNGFRADLAPYCRAGEVLRAHRVGYDDAVASGRTLPQGDTPQLSSHDRRRWRKEFAGLSFGQDLGAAVDAAREHAARLGHPHIGTSHLLAALLADPDGGPVMLLRSMGIHPHAVAQKAAALANRVAAAGALPGPGVL